MLVLVPRASHGQRDAALPFDVRHQQQWLVPGAALEARLGSSGERHLHLLNLTRTSLVTATVESSSEIELVLLDSRRPPRPGPSAQRLLAPGCHWVEIRTRNGRGAGGRYRLRVHCVEL